jgi:glycosyltransferase involved in cell wall biosynthesis
MELLAGRGAAVHLTVAGPSRDVVLQMLGRSGRTCPPWLTLVGFLPHAQARALVATSDFSVLLRRPSRVAEAGFSTKFVESIACGTPVIGNLTGDLGHYLHQGATGFICDPGEPASVVEAIERAMALALADRQAMRAKVLEMGRIAFNPARHVEALRSLMAVVIGKHGPVGDGA